eukprot:TRINITY_DN32660_c0_g1_i1.p1 TRINITY_DN32660_c0_g1~~TRINITY_DN32660_c0_g1_i1.p1  ORF type:complete len:900 (+),score=235.98 TRINITY_DN32660_c0_g1_i1:216-2702(+)
MPHTEVEGQPMSAYAKRVYYTTFAIPAAYFAAGMDNAVGVVLANGKYNRPVTPDPRWNPYRPADYTWGPRMLLLELTVTMAGGAVVTLRSDPTSGAWTATDGGPIVFSQHYSGEDRDVAREVPGWDSAGFDASANPAVAWAPAAACRASYSNATLRPNPIPPVTIMDALPVRSVVPSLYGDAVVADIGKNIAGFPALTLAAVPAGMNVRVTPSEVALSPGNVYQGAGSGAPYYWQLLNPPAGVPVHVTSNFSTYGGRYFEVKFVPRAPPPPPAAAAPAPAPTGGVVVVTAASYGANCGYPAPAQNLTAHAAAACDGASACSYTVCWGPAGTACGPGATPAAYDKDPYSGCEKHVMVTWRCSNAPEVERRAVVADREGAGVANAVTCEAAPPAPPVLPEITGGVGYEIRAALREVGTWESSNALVNAIHAMIIASMKANLWDVFTDCPHRERDPWLEQSHLLFEALAYNFDIRRLWEKIAFDTVDCQLPDGTVPDVCPEYVNMTGAFRDSPEWGSARVLVPDKLRAFYGSDVDVSTYAASQRYVAHLLGKVDNATGLLAYGLGDWLAVRPSPLGVTATGTLMHDLEAMVRAARRVGAEGDAKKYGAALAALRASYFKAFCTGNYTAQAAAGYALTRGALPTDAERQRAAAFLVDDLQARGYFTSGDTGTLYVMEALGDAAGGVEAVWASLQRTESPSYGYLVERGETALPESWTDDLSLSHMHAMLGHIEEFLYKHVAGIQQAANSTGWERVVLAPRPPLAEGPGAFVNATFDSPRGVIKSHAMIVSREEVVLAVQCPVGVPCEVRLPLSGRRVDLGTRGEEVRIVDTA